MAKRQLVVTGGYGNLGQALRQVVGATWEVIALGREDMADAEALVPDHADVILIASYNLKDRFVEKPSQYINDNVGSVARILELAAARRVSLVGFVSSAAVYGNLGHAQEDAPLRPELLSGSVKALCEKMVHDFCKGHGIPFQIYRVFNIYGGNDHFSVVSRLLNAVRKAAPFSLANGGSAQRDFVHVDDVASTIAQLWDSPFRNGVINCGSGRGVRISTLVDLAHLLRPGFSVHTTKADEVEACIADPSLLNAHVGAEFRRIEDWLSKQLEGAEGAEGERG